MKRNKNECDCKNNEKHREYANRNNFRNKPLPRFSDNSILQVFFILFLMIAYILIVDTDCSHKPGDELITKKCVLDRLKFKNGNVRRVASYE